jgi:tetratricopeptide (TPR) repeat protein
MRRRTVVIGILLLPLAVSSRLTALYVTPEIRQVPVERLVSNLQREVQSDPKSVQKIINLARLHAMAFALKADELPVADFGNKTEEVPWFGFDRDHIPYKAVPAPSPAKASEAQQHLENALKYYESALALDPDNLTARLGHAWLLEQSQKKKEAIAEYRSLIELAWKNEQKASRGSRGRRFYTDEAGGYLIALLDPKQDAAEIAELQARRDKLRALPRPITPIAIPLRDELAPRDVLDPLARVRFDADGSGLRLEWSWITSDAGWLVYDAEGKGAITSALQWFGNVTFWLFWSNGYEALRALDDNADGELTGAELQHLAIWHDRNSNGASEAGEVRPLASHGIIALSCQYELGDGARLAAMSRAGVRFSDGRTRPTYDVILRQGGTVLTRK